jgi:hypothetical protein
VPSRRPGRWLQRRVREQQRVRRRLMLPLTTAAKQAAVTGLCRSRGLWSWALVPRQWQGPGPRHPWRAHAHPQLQQLPPLARHLCQHAASVAVASRCQPRVTRCSPASRAGRALVLLGMQPQQLCRTRSACMEPCCCAVRCADGARAAPGHVCMHARGGRPRARTHARPGPSIMLTSCACRLSCCLQIGLLDNITEHSDVVDAFALVLHRKRGRLGPAHSAAGNCRSSPASAAAAPAAATAAAAAAAAAAAHGAGHRAADAVGTATHCQSSRGSSPEPRTLAVVRVVRPGQPAAAAAADVVSGRCTSSPASRPGSPGTGGAAVTGGCGMGASPGAASAAAAAAAAAAGGIDSISTLDAAEVLELLLLVSHGHACC